MSPRAASSSEPGRRATHPGVNLVHTRHPRLVAPGHAPARRAGSSERCQAFVAGSNGTKLSTPETVRCTNCSYHQVDKGLLASPCKQEARLETMITTRAVTVLLACGAAVPHGNGLSAGQSCFVVPAPKILLALASGARRQPGAALVLPRRPRAAPLDRRLAFHDAFDQQSDDLRTLCGLAPEARCTKQRPCAPQRSRSLTVLASRSVQFRRG